ncbi:MAG TPA: hypothetical protein VFJ87_00435 [Rhodanobacteraceae bacterium]|nr:hypothetical protein [Rhodanobacteraceae bacterium]
MIREDPCESVVKTLLLPVPCTEQALPVYLRDKVALTLQEQHGARA